MADKSQFLSVIEVWAAIAWADGVLAEPEAEGLKRLIKTADLTPEERESAAVLLTKKVDLPGDYLAGLSTDARKGIYRNACRMAVVDHVFANSERIILDRLKAKLEIPGEIAQEIEAGVPGLVL